MGKIIFLCLLFCCTQTLASTEDPLENYNRHAFRMNKKLDTVILKPIASLYSRTVPKIIQKSVHNFYNNLREVPALFNDILQLNGYQSLSDGWRLLINSTVGIGGLFDVAVHMGLPQHNNDFGLTLARYGYRNSTYFVLPFWGPSTLRDAGAMIPYCFQTVYPYIRPSGLGWGIFAGDVVDLRTQYLSNESLIQEISLDPYSFQRNAYLQFRNNQIAKETGLGASSSDNIDAALDEALQTKTKKS